MTQRSSQSPTIQVPAEVYLQQTQHQLGEFTYLFRPILSNIFMLIGLIVGSLLLDIVLLVGMAYFLGYILYILALFPIFVILFAADTLPTVNSRIYVFEHGLVHAKGPRCEAVPWSQITSIWQKEAKSRYKTSAYTCTLRLQDGRKLKFRHTFRSIRQLTRLIQQEVAKQQLPATIAAFDRGDTVSFGRVNVNRQGINNSKELIPWDQVDTLTLKEGLVVVQKYGRTLKWSPVREKATPNLATLMGLVDYVIKNQR